MTNALYTDISAWQPTTIDWQAYKNWSAAGDGTSRIAIKATEGLNYVSPHFEVQRAGALGIGIDQIILYHYALGEDPGEEASFLWSVVKQLREHDLLMLDLEVNVSPGWAVAFLEKAAALSGRPPALYASDSFIRTHLQDGRLAAYPLILANWTFNANARPSCPPPWHQYEFLQWTDHLQVPGIPGFVDADLYAGPEPVPGPPPPQPPPVPPERTYTVVSGDTLWALSERFHTTVESLYNANSEEIESWARKVGLVNSDHGRWIFPGEVLKV